MFCVAVVALPAAQQQDDVKSRKDVRDPVYTTAQAERGKQVYEANCVTCHLADLDGSANPTAGARGAPLTGTRFVQDFGEKKVSALFNKMKRDMPSGRPGALTDQEYLDAATYVLQKNNFPAGPAELTTEVADNVWIPGAGGAEGLENYTFVSAVGCLHQDPTRSWLLTNAEELKKTEPSAAVKRQRDHNVHDKNAASSRSACSMPSATTPNRTTDTKSASRATWCGSVRKYA